MTYAGQDMTFLAAKNDAPSNQKIRSEMWYITAPATGTNDIYITFSDDIRAVAGGMSYTGVDQDNPFGTPATAGGDSATPSVTISSAPGELVVDTVGVRQDDPPNVTLTKGANQTERYNDASQDATAYNNVVGAGSEEAGAASVTMSWTASASRVWAIVAAPLKPVADAAAFNYLSSPQDISPGTAGSWTDVDVSAYIPSGATGVILQWSNPTATDYVYGVRNNGSTDDPTVDQIAKGNSQGWFMVGVDANRIFEAYVENTALKTYLLGYTMSGVTFFTNWVDKTPTTDGTWQDIDISSDSGGDTAIGAIFYVLSQSGNGRSYGLRKNGSTDELYTQLRAETGNLGIIGVDSSEICEAKIEDQTSTIKMYLVGYVTSGAVFFTNAVDKSWDTEDDWHDVDITGDLQGSDDANGGIVMFNQTNNRRKGALREKGAGYDYYEDVSHQFALVGIDSDDIFQQKVGWDDMDLHLIGYTLESGTGSLTKAAARPRPILRGTATTGRLEVAQGMLSVTRPGSASPAVMRSPSMGAMTRYVFPARSLEPRRSGP
jgi:hypothetical protein